MFICWLIFLIATPIFALPAMTYSDSQAVVHQHEKIISPYEKEAEALHDKLLSQLKKPEAFYQGVSPALKSEVSFKQTTESPLLFFVSFSMPDESLKAWLKTAKQMRAPILIRGLVDNAFQETISKLSTLIGEDVSGVQLHPDAFEEFGVTQVPAIVVVDSISKSKTFDVIYGDISLAYALKQITLHGESKIVASRLLKQLEQTV